MDDPQQRGKPLDMKTRSIKASEIRRDWYVVDAEGQVLGRLASKVATILRGKNKPEYTPHLDVGDHVIVVNAEKIVLTGRKELQKKYFYHTGYPGGGKSIDYLDLKAKNPARIIEMAVKGMLPHNPLGRRMWKKLKVYRGPDHPHDAQNPVRLEL
jgi:large subunit ribosomal protein L13